MAVIVHPEPGNAAAIGQALLALADHPQQVQWVTWPQAGFQVPDELYDRFVTPPATEPRAEQPKRRGRARKTDTAHDADSNETEER